jgi:hypothetical protein
MSKKNKTMTADEIGLPSEDNQRELDMQGEVGSDPVEVKEKSTAEVEIDKRVAELEAELLQAKLSNKVDVELMERIAHLEGMIGNKKTQEQLYIERCAKYDKNVAARKAKDAKRDALLSDLDKE